MLHVCVCVCEVGTEHVCTMGDTAAAYSEKERLDDSGYAVCVSGVRCCLTEKTSLLHELSAPPPSSSSPRPVQRALPAWAGGGWIGAAQRSAPALPSLSLSLTLIDKSQSTHHTPTSQRYTQSQ